MASMSYCRFRNTEIEIDNCIEALEDRKIYSEEEKTTARRVLKKILNFCKSECIIDGFNMDQVTAMIDDCKEEEWIEL